jgi:predicted AlkP superfamily phosphohydrolase/phosphomutase
MTRFRGVILTVAAITIAFACNGRPHVGRKVIVLGFDGLDYEVTRQLIDAGRLPGFSRLAAGGGFTSLATTIPPQSPVAWSTFITGRDPGEHGIFDFVHRDPKTMAPYLSTTRAESARTIGAGPWQLPIGSGRVESLRQGQPFWEVLEARGIPTTVIRMPANFPPSGTATRELSGMGTPDLQGGYGTFAIFTSRPYAAEQQPAGGIAYSVTVRDGLIEAALEGPGNPYLKSAEKLRAPFSARRDVAGHHVLLTVGTTVRLLKVGEWSDWIPVTFPMVPMQSLHGQVRFFLKSLDPFVELYASPINIDPLAPAMPIAHPEKYAAELAEATGRFYTQGMPEDTKALKAGVLSDAEFLAQARLAADENLRQYEYVLDRFSGGLLFYYFGNVDQVSHMMWRARDPGHPAYNAVADAPNAAVVTALYEGLDAVVTQTLDRLGPDDLLVVMSDHGFTSWRRAFNMNSWLRDHGYLALVDPNRADDPGLFANVDWSRTRAYALGLNGLYLNVEGRERHGIVPPAGRAALADEIAAKLLATMDPATGTPAITKMYRRELVYHLAGDEDIAPDLIVGYAKGTRGSDESALGGLPREVITDNLSAWSGDHCMDPAAVPGILLSSRPMRVPAPSIQQLAGAVLAEFGITDFPQRTGVH